MVVLKFVFASHARALIEHVVFINDSEVSGNGGSSRRSR
jgi:hypothetical protein